MKKGMGGVLIGIWRDSGHPPACSRNEIFRQPSFTRTGPGDKVQVIGTVVSMQAASHTCIMLSAGSQPTLAKKRKDGAPTFRYRKRRAGRGEGWATRLAGSTEIGNKVILTGQVG